MSVICVIFISFFNIFSQYTTKSNINSCSNNLGKDFEKFTFTPKFDIST